MTLAETLAPYVSEVETQLHDILGHDPLPFYGMMRYHLGWEDEQFRPLGTHAGKRLRPVICLLACESVGGSRQSALPAAAALELLHNFSLIHDDVEDCSHERHHRKTVWSIWGEAQAINAGDGMHVVARLALLRLLDTGVASSTLSRALRLFDQTCLRLCEGQYMDISFQKRLDVSVDEYLDMVSRKTGALLECSLELGAMLGTEDERRIEGLRRFGAELGLAFQIRDDILGIWGDEKTTGKAAGDDIRQRKKTLPVVHAMEAECGRWREELTSIFRQERVPENGVERVLEILDLSGSRLTVQSAADRHYEMALRFLRGTEGTPAAVSVLEQVAAFVTQRNF